MEHALFTQTLSPADGDRDVSGAVDKAFRDVWRLAVWHLPTNEAVPRVGTLIDLDSRIGARTSDRPRR